MRYMMMILGDADYEAGKQATAELQEQMGEFIGKLAAEGVFIDGNGMLPSRHGFRASLKEGAVSITDGPFAESKEIVGGYAVVEVQSEEQARQITHDFLMLHEKNGVHDAECIIRRLEDFPEA